jgi:hypothetical protein
MTCRKTIVVNLDEGSLEGSLEDPTISKFNSRLHEDV